MALLPVGTHRLLILASTGSSTVGLDALKLWLDRKMGCTPYAMQLVACQPCPPVRGLSEVFLWLLFGSNSGSWEVVSLAPSLGAPLCSWLSHKRFVSLGFESFDRDTTGLKEKEKYLLFVQLKSAERIFSELCGQKLAKWEADIQSLIGTF